MQPEKQTSASYKIKSGAIDHYAGLLNALKNEGFQVIEGNNRGKLKIMNIVRQPVTGEAIAEIILEDKGFNKIARTLRIFDEQIYPICKAFVYPIKSFQTKGKNTKLSRINRGFYFIYSMEHAMARAIVSRIKTISLG